MSIRKLTFYTDGSYQPSVNPNVSGWGFYCLETKFSASGVVENPTSRNIDGEIMAVIQAIEHLKDMDLSNIDKIEIVHDYQGVGCWARKEWKRNKFLTINYVNFLDKNKEILDKVTFTWVKGHSGNEQNDLVDSLAKEAVVKTLDY